VTNLPKPLRGIIVPMVTPLRDRETLDVEGLARLVEHILAGGVHGVFILGTTGEAPSLSMRLRRELVERVCTLVGRRVPVLVGVTDTSLIESVGLARAAAEAGAQAVVLSAPHYFPASQPELIDYLDHITAELPLPVFLYNMPSHTKITFGLEVLRRAIEIPQVVGLKDSSGKMIYFHEVLRLRRRRPDWSVLVGPEQLLGEAVLVGGDGGVCGGANLWPRLYVEVYEAAAARDLARLAALQEQVMRVTETIYAVGKHGSAVIKGLKCALSCLGICDDFMADPFHRFLPAERAHIQRHLGELGIEAARV
jgi:dihydrodipicolinate synthase/N-acetylneuraminate lyase